MASDPAYSGGERR